MRPVAWATGHVWFSVRRHVVSSEPSEPSRTLVCLRRKLELLLMGLLNIYYPSLHQSPLPLYLRPPRLPSPSQSSQHFHIPIEAQSSPKLRGGSIEKQIFPPQLLSSHLCNTHLCTSVWPYMNTRKNIRIQSTQRKDTHVDIEEKHTPRVNGKTEM